MLTLVLSPRPWSGYIVLQPGAGGTLLGPVPAASVPKIRPSGDPRAELDGHARFGFGGRQISSPQVSETRACPLEGGKGEMRWRV